MILSLIVAISRERAIGRDNTLPWYLPADLKRFKELTTGHAILMGRKTFESLPNGPLPKRRNVVISTSLNHIEGAEVFATIDEALEALNAEEEVFVIGGGQVYAQLLKRADKLYLTQVDTSIADADTFFPEWRSEEWATLRRIECPRDERNEYDSVFIELQRKQGLA